MREGFCQADCGYLVFYEQTGFCHMFRRLDVPDIHNLVTVSRELLEVSLWSLIVPHSTLAAMCILLTVHELMNSACLQLCPVFKSFIIQHLHHLRHLRHLRLIWANLRSCQQQLPAGDGAVLLARQWRKNRTGKELILSSAQKLHQSESWKLLEVKGTRLEEITRFKRFCMENKDSFPVSATNFEQFESFSYRRRQLQQCSRFSGIKPTELLQEFQMKPCGHADLHLSHIWLISIQALLILSIRTDSLRIWFVIYSYLFMRLQLASQPYKFQENSTKKQDKVLAFGRT